MKRIEAISSHLVSATASDKTRSSSYDVVIVGGSTAGASAAYHLTAAGVRVLLVEAGVPGFGTTERNTNVGDKKLENATERDSYMCGVAGSAVPRNTIANDGSGGMAVKMMLGGPLAGKASDFIDVHGRAGLLKAFKLSMNGLELQKQLAKKYLPHADTQLRELGTVYLATPEQEAEMVTEYGVLKELGVNVMLWDKRQVESLYGSGGGYVRGLGYPSDAIINSQEYSATLLRVAVATGLCTALLGHRVVDIKDNGTEAVTILSDGARFTSRHVVVATGGLWFNNLPSLPLAPYIKPCWSYLVVMNGTSHQADTTRPQPPPQRDSPNLLTYCQTRDWAICRGVLRLSGEDNNSAQTQPHTAVRLNNLAQWAYDRFSDEKSKCGFTIKRDTPYESLYGVYSETKDGLPFLGTLRGSDRICYLMGCNARGQATLTFGASVVPGLLGYTRLTEEQATLAALLSPNRATAKTYSAHDIATAGGH